MRGRFCLTLATAILALSGSLSIVSSGANAQSDYPNRPITLIIPTPPGGGTDTLGRRLAEAVEPILGQKLVVENRPGGGGSVGVTLISQARPDGYTLGMIWNGPLTALPHTLQVPYTPESYTPIIQIGSSSYVMCVAPDFPASNAEEFIAELRNNPGKYTYGNDGVGGTMQLGAERIFKHFGIKARAVPFGGAGETARNFLGGHVDIYGGSLPPILPHVKAGKAKCPLLTSADDNPALPDASGLHKLGVPELETVLWWGVIGPKDLPDSIVAKLEQAFRNAADTPLVKDGLAQIGASPVIRDGKEMAQLVKRESEALGEVARDLGLEQRPQ